MITRGGVTGVGSDAVGKIISLRVACQLQKVPTHPHTLALSLSLSLSRSLCRWSPRPPLPWLPFLALGFLSLSLSHQLSLYVSSFLAFHLRSVELPRACRFFFFLGFDELWVCGLRSVHSRLWYDLGVFFLVREHLRKTMKFMGATPLSLSLSCFYCWCYMVLSAFFFVRISWNADFWFWK